jgi:SAM-dependent methyltransferase
MNKSNIHYSDKNNNIARERLNPGLSHSRYVHLKLLKKHVERLVNENLMSGKKIKLADMGCGELPYISIIKPHVHEYLGIDLPGNINADVLVDLKSNRCDLENNSCDIVLSIQVLSNTTNPKKYLKECFRILKPKGKLLLSTHGHWPYNPDPFDYGRWTSMGLKLEIENAGFKIIELKGMMGLLSTSIQILQDAVLISVPYRQIWGTTFCFLMQRLIQLSEWYVSKSKTLKRQVDKDACVYIVVAHKD